MRAFSRGTRGLPSSERAGTGRRGGTPVSAKADEPKKKTNYKAAWAETRRLMWSHRRALGVGLALMLVNRLSGLVLPGSAKWIIDEVLTKNRIELLTPIAIAAGIATLLQQVPLPLAALHQAGAVVVFTCAIGLRHALRA